MQSIRFVLSIVFICSAMPTFSFRGHFKLGAGSYDQQQLLSTNSIPSRNYSVGFSLASSYGAAAVIIDDINGEQKTLTWVIYGDRSYQTVMAKLSLDASQHLAPPYDNMQQYFDDIPRVMERRSRKKVGLPATSDIGALATVIKKLRSEIESDLKITVLDATLAATHLVALYQDDIEDICEYAGFKYIIPKNLFEPILWETSCTYSGCGFGLCENWQNDTQCGIENDKLPDVSLLAIHYSRTALTSTLSQIHVAISSWEGYGRRVEDFNLGSDGKAWYSNEDKYWDDVKEALVRKMVETPAMRKPEKIILTGDAIDADFLRALKDALMSHMGVVPTIILDDPVVVAAKGAAEFRRRGQASWQ